MGDIMKFKQLIYIYETNNSQSFSKAAKKLELSQPSLSVQVNDLEKEIGFKVFERNNTGTYITERGKEFINEVTPLIKSYNNLKKKYTDKRKNMIISTNTNGFVYDAYARYLKNDKCNLVKISHEDIVQSLMNNESDISIICTTERLFKKMKPELTLNNIKYEKLLTTPMCCAIGNGSSLNDLNEVDIKDLKNKFFIRVSSLFSDEKTIKKELSVLGLSNNNKTITIESTDEIVRILNELDSFTINSNIKNKACNYDNIKYLPINNVDLKFDFYLLKRNHFFKKEEEQYVSILKEIIENITYLC